MIVAAAVAGVACSAAAAEWKEKSGDHFIVFYSGDDQFAREVLRKAENYYREIASGLGYPRYSDFWLWDDRVKIYIYPDHQTFVNSTGESSRSHGVADYRGKQVMSYAWSEGFVESLLPHEIAHLIFRDFVGFRGEVPAWLDEGVAQWSEKDKRPYLRALVKKQFADSSLLTVDDMMSINLRRLMESDNRVYIRPTRDKEGDQSVLFLDSEAIINAYYLQGFSFVDYLITRFGTDSFTVFCRQLRDGKSMEGALRQAYGTYIKDLPEFEKRWREFVEGQ